MSSLYTELCGETVKVLDLRTVPLDSLVAIASAALCVAIEWGNLGIHADEGSPGHEAMEDLAAAAQRVAELMIVVPGAAPR